MSSEIVVRKIDSTGRISLPAEWRKKYGKRVILRKLPESDSILIRPLTKKIKAKDLFDTIEVKGEVDFTDPHDLRRAVYE